MAGKLYGVGVGPGNPELLTLQAVRVIKACDVLIVPGENPQETVAYKIAESGIPQIAEKKIIGVHMPMTKDKEQLAVFHEKAAAVIGKILESGADAAFLTLGDPCIYSTYLYIHKQIQRAGYETQIINGIPSFLAVSAKLNEGLAEQSEMLHVIPASYQIEEGLSLKGTKVLMKAGKKVKNVREYLQQEKLSGKVVECCGMENEKVYLSAEELPDDLSYYSIIVVKEEKEA